MPHGWFDTAVGRYDERSIAVTNETRPQIGELLWRRLLSVYVPQPCVETTRGAVVDARQAHTLKDPQLKQQT